MRTTERSLPGASAPMPRANDQPRLGEALGRLHRPLAAFAPAFAVAESPGLADGITFANTLRLRLIAVTLLFTQPILIGLDWMMLEASPPTSLPAPWMAWAVIAFRAAMCVASLLLLAAFANVSDIGDIRPRHRVYQVGYTLFCILLATVWTGARWPVTVTVYSLAIFAGAALIAFPWRQSLSMYGTAWLVLMVVLAQPQPIEAMVVPNFANGTLLTLLAVALARVTYVSEARQFQNEQVIERQRGELETAVRQLAVANATLEHMSFVDSLTGLPNRRYFDDQLAREWRRAQREQTHLTLIMIDVDYFKQYNDTYGHPAGDECLRQVAQAMDAALNRPADLLARYGGDEFAAILPNTDAPGAQHAAQRIHSAVSALSAIHAGSPRGLIAVSLGVACRVPARDESLADMIAAADAALYRAKADGRNRCVVAV